MTTVNRSLSNSTGSLSSPRGQNRVDSLSGSIYVCCRCQSGIIMDPSLEDIDEIALLPNSNEDNEDSPLSKTSMLIPLLELASNSTDIDHPLCGECSQLVVYELHKQLAELDMENERYSQYYDQLKEEKNKKEAFQEKIKHLQSVETDLNETLEALTFERHAIEDDIEKQILHSCKADLIEERYLLFFFVLFD